MSTTPEPRTPNLRIHDNNGNSSDLPLSRRRNITDQEPINEEENKQNAETPAPSKTPIIAAIFKSNTIAPSPPNGTPSNERANFSVDTSRHLPLTDSLDGHSTPLSAGLRIHTDIIPPSPLENTTAVRGLSDATRIPALTKTPSIPIAPVARTPSIKNVFASSVGSNYSTGSRPGSAISSPMLNAMADVTPLPSPLMSGDSPGPWKKLSSRPTSRDLMIPMSADSALVTANGESIASAITNQNKRRAYQGLAMSSTETGLQNAQANKDKAASGHQRNRSISEYTPEAVQAPKARHITVSGSHTAIDSMPDPSLSGDMFMRREPHLAAQRGLAPTKRPPTPPSSRTGGESSDSDSSIYTSQLGREKMGSNTEYFDAKTRDGTKRRWRALRTLGEGTFSRVMLATSQLDGGEEKDDADDVFGQRTDRMETSVSEFDRKRRQLVAIKVCEAGPRGGASEQRIEMSLKRELDIMISIHHPSLVHLKAWNIEETRALLVLSYCPGGDLFEVASRYRSILVPSLLRRMFAELTEAVQYLHKRHIVHRDIKLESKKLLLDRRAHV